MYQLLGYVAANKLLNAHPEIQDIIIRHCCENLLQALQSSKQHGDFKTLTEILKLLVDLTRGFHYQIERPGPKQYFDQVLEEVLALFKIPGLNQLSALQDQIIKYLDRNITIMGINAKPLICEMVQYQLQ